MAGELEEDSMVAAGVPPERATAEVWVIPELEQSTLSGTALDDAADDPREAGRRRARAHLIGALLLGARHGLSAAELQGELSAAFAEVFARDGSLRTLAETYGWQPPVGNG